MSCIYGHVFTTCIHYILLCHVHSLYNVYTTNEFVI